MDAALLELVTDPREELLCQGCDTGAHADCHQPCMCACWGEWLAAHDPDSPAAEHAQEP